MALQLEVVPDADTAAERVAAYVGEQARRAIADGRHFTFAVSRMPPELLAQLADELPWEKVTVYQVDERVAPEGHAERNLTALRDHLPPEADIRAMPVEASDLDAAAAEFARSLPDRLDLVHLGLGPDGHTASLVPGDPVLGVRDRDVAVTREYLGRRRLTLTYPALDRAHQVLWLVTGEDKADALRRLLEGDRSIPGSRVSTAHALVIADAAAAGR